MVTVVCNLTPVQYKYQENAGKLKYQTIESLNYEIDVATNY